MDAPNTEPIYENAPGNAEELERSIRVCLMGSDAGLPLTCHVKAGDIEAFAAAWNRWRRTLFGDVLAPHLINAFGAARGHDVKQLLEMDRALDDQLQSQVAERSALAGSQFHASLDGARHIRLMDKLRRAVARRNIAGHHATFFACEAAMFNVPLMHLLPAYLFAEWRGARAHAGVPRAMCGLGAFEDECGDALAQARRISASPAGGQPSLSICA